MTVSEKRPSDLDILEQYRNVEEILKVLAPILLKLEIAGDLVEFHMFTAIQWPRLRSLQFANHMPYRDIIPMPQVVSKMPLLETLGYNFHTSAESRDPEILCYERGASETAHCASLRSVVPDLKSLSISNVKADDTIIEQLPEGLETLRVSALRDPCREARMSLHGGGKCCQYNPLDRFEALRWIEAASKLSSLQELALALKEPPSPTLLAEVVSACPQLRVLELQQARFEKSNNKSLYTLVNHVDSVFGSALAHPLNSQESLVEPLKNLRHLRDLRITIGLGIHNPPALRRGTWNYPDITSWHDIMNMGHFFAARLPSLTSLSFSYHNPGLQYSIRRHSMWKRMSINRGDAGKPPYALFDRFL
ncbi:hypothetical protein H0H81_004569 [Sphagnurus paluster]|uniref:Uncharacterized protein n=1 Tax=Sphagnurus paluster TaxID=117069 RepID=A0A9P7KLC4_9AGAR|nr:hypothetical protein H0H81_004569 [Sphagnurus paluster]